MTSLQDKVALVTGSSRGIGAAIARAFAEQGASVVVHGRDAAAVGAVRDEITAAGGKAFSVLGDVTSFAQLEAMREEIEQHVGPVDVLVANAGGSFTPPAPLEEIPEDGWRASVDGNLTATFLTLKSFVPGMKARRQGAIITISSTAARRPHPGSPMPYAAAKAGIQLMTQALAAQVGPFGVRASCIAPETILTERNLERIPAEQREALAEAHALRRLGTPEDVARAAVFLASEQSSWITGAILDVAGNPQ